VIEENFNKMTTKIYSLYSHFYDSIFGAIFHPGHRAASKLMNIQPGERVLEVGIGTGMSLCLYPGNVEIVGIDINQDMINQAGGKKQRMGYTNVKLCIMDAIHYGELVDRRIQDYVSTFSLERAFAAQSAKRAH